MQTSNTVLTVPLTDGFCVETVKAEFVLNIEQDEDAARHPDGEAEDVDEGIDLLPEHRDCAITRCLETDLKQPG